MVHLKTFSEVTKIRLAVSTYVANTCRILVTVVNPFQELVEVLLGQLLAEAAGRGLQLVEQGVLQVLKHEVEPPLATEHLDHIHQVVVAKFLECLVHSSLSLICVTVSLRPNSLDCLPR